MKKVRFLALALVAAMALTGAGYAYWTDTLTINNTVSTGEFNVEFTQADVDSVELAPTDYVVTTDATIGDNTKDVALTMSNLYPGASVDFDVRFDNTGSIPAVLNGITVANTPSEDGLTDKILVTGNVTQYDENGVLKGSWGLPGTTTLSNLQSVLNYVQPRLEPNDYVVVDVNMLLDSTVSGDDYEEANVTSLFTVNFKQHNAQ